MYELFGSKFNQVEFLGSFYEESQLLRAVDEFVGLGYSKVKFCKFGVR